MLKKVRIISEKEIKIKKGKRKPKFLKPYFVKASREGQLLYWERIKAHDSVHILIVNKETKEIIIVKQVRIPVLCNDDSKNGEVFEACAGLVDKKGKTISEIAAEEVLEEVGYKVSLPNLKLIRKLKSNVGGTGTNSYAFIIEITESMRINDGGGLNTEDIEVVRIPFEEVYDFAYDNENHTDAITFSLLNYWLLSQVK